MKLRQLAGYSPVAAFVSAGCLVIVSVTQQITFPPSLFVPAAIVFLVAMFVWVVALAATVFELRWLGHPAAGTRWFRIALGATLVAMMTPLLLGLIEFAGLGVSFVIPYVILFIGVGLSLLIHNVGGLRTGILHRALPWVGILAGAGFIYLGVLQSLVPFTHAFVTFWYFGLVPTQVLCLVWTIWMGVHLSRSKARSRAAAAA